MIVSRDRSCVVFVACPKVLQKVGQPLMCNCSLTPSQW